MLAIADYSSHKLWLGIIIFYLVKLTCIPTNSNSFSGDKSLDFICPVSEAYPHTWLFRYLVYKVPGPACTFSERMREELVILRFTL